jgi:hypothetical protein
MWKPWAIVILGLVVALHGYAGSPTWYLAIGLVTAALALWIALERVSNFRS